jgi:molybdenum cofactor cytidylyltransferase
MIAGLILAAGESSRMGTDKPLLTYRGRTFLETIVLCLRAAGLDRVAVVLGHHAKEIQHSIKLEGVEVVINRDYQRGQTTSLQAGLRALEAPELEGVVLCLVDHPAVSARVVEQLIARFKGSRAAAAIPTYEGHRGHPVLIGRGLFRELLEVSPDQGANSVFRRYRDTTQFVQVEERGILLDVDDPKSYRQLQAGKI